MTLENAISYVIDKEGLSILSESRFGNFLNDLQAFETPAVKRIIFTLSDEGYFGKLLTGLSSDNYELQFNDVSMNLIQKEGYQPDLVQYILDCLLYAVHKSNKTPIMPMSATKTTKKKRADNQKATFSVIQTNDKYVIEFEGISYELKESQYRAFVRKKDIPANRLKVWLDSYSEENK